MTSPQKLSGVSSLSFSLCLPPLSLSLSFSPLFHFPIPLHISLLLAVSLAPPVCLPLSSSRSCDMTICRSSLFLSFCLHLFLSFSPPSPRGVLLSVDHREPEENRQALSGSLKSSSACSRPAHRYQQERPFLHFNYRQPFDLSLISPPHS